jgi:hypothetical protein
MIHTAADLAPEAGPLSGAPYTRTVAAGGSNVVLKSV